MTNLELAWAMCPDPHLKQSLRGTGAEWEELVGQCRGAVHITLYSDIYSHPWLNPYLVGLRFGQPNPREPQASPGRIELPQGCDWYHCFSSQPDPWNTHVWKGTNGTPTKRRAIGFKKLAE